MISTGTSAVVRVARALMAPQRRTVSGATCNARATDAIVAPAASSWAAHSLALAPGVGAAGPVAPSSAGGALAGFTVCRCGVGIFFSARVIGSATGLALDSKFKGACCLTHVGREGFLVMTARRRIPKFLATG